MPNMRTRQPRLPLWNGLQEKHIFQWGRQNSGGMVMPTLKSNDNGHLVDFTMSICVNRCSPMPPWPARVNTTAPSARARGNPHCNETWKQNLPPWSSFALTPPEKIYKTCTGMYISSRGYLEGASVRKLPRSASTRTSSIPSRNASSSSSHLHSQRGNGDRCQPMSLGPITVWSLLQLTAAPMRSSQWYNRIHAWECWLWWWTPTGRQSWQQQCSRRR